MATLQVRGIDDDLYRALGARARAENRSISQQVVTIIEEHLARAGRGDRRPTDAFLEICGTWEDPRDAADIAAEVRAARRSGRRPTGFDDVPA